MSTVTPIATRKNADQPRAVLCEVIARMEKAQAAVAAKDKALDRARHFLHEIEDRIVEAATAVTTAREEHARRVADAIADDEKPPAATGGRAARNVETGLQDQLEAARSTIDRLTVSSADASSELERGRKAVDAAVAAALGPVAASMLEEAKKLRTQYLSRAYALDTLRP